MTSRRVGACAVSVALQRCAASLFRRHGRVGRRLRRTLAWWLEILELGIAQERRWDVVQRPPVHLFCDAAGNPARLAAVLCLDGRIMYTDCPPPHSIVEALAVRADQQIMGLELLSIALGLSTFQEECRDRCVVVHSDNKGTCFLPAAGCAFPLLHCLRTGAEHAAARGSAKSFDHRDIIHEMWTQATIFNMCLWIVRVATDDNIADLPSRCDYAALHSVAAEWRLPRLEGPCWARAAWEDWLALYGSR